MSDYVGVFAIPEIDSLVINTNPKQKNIPVVSDEAIEIHKNIGLEYYIAIPIIELAYYKSATYSKFKIIEISKHLLSSFYIDVPDGDKLVNVIDHHILSTLLKKHDVQKYEKALKSYLRAIKPILIADDGSIRTDILQDIVQTLILPAQSKFNRTQMAAKLSNILDDIKWPYDLRTFIISVLTMHHMIRKIRSVLSVPYHAAIWFVEEYYELERTIWGTIANMRNTLFETLIELQYMKKSPATKANYQQLFDSHLKHALYQAIPNEYHHNILKAIKRKTLLSILEKESFLQSYVNESLRPQNFEEFENYAKFITLWYNDNRIREFLWS